MKVSQLINKLPLKVKLTNGFTLEESFDIGTILLITKCIPDIEGSYEIHVVACNEDMSYNKKIASRDWFNSKTSKYNATIYEFNDDNYDEDGNYKDIIYVMDSDDFCELHEDSNNENLAKQIIIELDKYARNYGMTEYGLPIDPDMIDQFESPESNEMVDIVTKILKQKN